MTVLEKVRESRTVIESEIDEILADETRNTTPEGIARLAELNTEAAEIAEREKVVEEAERRQAIAAEASAKLPAEPRKSSATHISGEPRVYSKGNGASYYRDLATSQFLSDREAGMRLSLHMRQVTPEIEEIDRRRDQEAERGIRDVHADAFFGRPEQRVAPHENRTNPNRTDGTGGYFVPPLWLIDEFVPLLRAGRTLANSVRQMPLPGGTDSINLPKVLTGTAAGIQTADAAAVTSTDFTDTFVSAGVKTLAGQQDVALQLVEQSPIAIDDAVIFPDLIADYNMKLDQQLYTGTNANGQTKGIDSISSGKTATYTDASPTVAELYPYFGQIASQVASARYAPILAWFMHPRRWYWIASALDGNNRPLVVPESNGPFNALSLQTGAEAEGPAGRIMGIPVMLDANVPTTKGGGTEDRIYGVRTSDLYLFEGAYRTRALQEVLSGNLQVRFQLYNYFAFMPDRYPVSIGQIQDTGLAAVSGY